jgi:sigma-E factor negative regulatory protein RseB
MMKIVFPLIIAFSCVAYADGLQPKQLLEEMCAAMSSQSYRGTFVHLHNNKIESMEIVRRKDENGEVEKLLSLNGEAREIIRNRDVVTCILPKSQKITIDKARAGSQLPLALPQNLDNIEIFYELSLDGAERIAGLDSTIVSLKPKDSYRYGHRIWVDKASKLMVKSDLLDEHGVPIEQIMFTTLVLDHNLPDSAFAPHSQADEFKRVEVSKGSMPERVEPMLKWQLTQAPHGFSLVSHTRQMAKSSQFPVEHMVLSDGMASVSVFIEPQQGKSLSGASRMGAVNAYGSLKAGHKVIVVGEVPAATVILINQHVERLQP